MLDVDGLTCWVSSHGMPETMRRLRDAVRDQGMAVFGHIDHGGAAAAAGLALSPSEVLIFGRVAAGTKLIQGTPSAGIDLPLRAMVWIDAAGTTWLAYNDPGWIAARHGARSGNDQVLADMRRSLAAIAEYAACPQSPD